MVNSGNRVEDLPFRIEKLPGSKKPAEMAGATKSPGCPQSAMAVCREVLKRVDKKAEGQGLKTEGKLR